MHHRCVSIIALLAAALAASAAEFKIGAHKFTLPDGFQIELVAGTNLVPRPIEADFDEQGRLYVTDSSGSNDKVEKQLQEKPHRVVRLEDTDGDGTFDKSVVFADKLMFPEGALWHDGSLFVAAPPSIWKLTDTNNDGMADVRSEWFQGKTLTGCANDLHGPYLGPDGWIYWCKGAFARQTYTLPNGKEFATRASHIFRARPDGTGIEPVMTGGMDNPVGLAFTAEGERILSCTFFQHPEGGHRDGLIHAIYGGVYGKVHDVLDGHTRTGDLMPVLAHLGPAAPVGLIRYESQAFDFGNEENLFVCSFNLHKVIRCALRPKGATFTTTESDFLVSDNPDFHPTDVLEDADGSLLVIDTGGWYKLCCPTSQLSKPDVLGGIYRIRRVNHPRIDDPRGRKIDWQNCTPNALAKYLGNHSRPRIAARAIEELARRNAVPALKEVLITSNQPDAQRDALWALIRIGTQPAREAVYALFAANQNRPVSRDESLARTAFYAFGLWRDRTAADGNGDAFSAMIAVNDALQSGPPSLRRAAAEAMGRGGLHHASAAQFLLKAAEQSARREKLDRCEEHSIIYALIEVNHPAYTRKGLDSSDPAVKRVALIALDQMDGKPLRADDVVPLLKSSDTTLKDTATWIISHRPEWGNELAQFFADEFKNAAEAAVAGLQQQLLPLITNQSIQQTIADLLASEALPRHARTALLQAISRSGLKQFPDAWNAQLLHALQSTDDTVVREAVFAARAASAKQDKSTRLALLAVAGDARRSKETRLAALSGASDLEGKIFDFVLGCLAPAEPLAIRSAASGVLARARLSSAQLAMLLPLLKTAGPMELTKLLGAFNRSTDEALGTNLINTLGSAAAISSLRADSVSSVLSNFPPLVRIKAKPLLDSLNSDAAKEKEHMDRLIADVKLGDVRRGQALFNSEKTACATCHAIGYLGGNVGPDLTRIGQIRTERDLLEAIVYPSASFVRSYESVMVSTRSGDDFSGILRKDAPDEIILVTGPNTEQRIPRSDISDMRPGSVSVMPGGLADQLTKEELGDLIAFLRNSK